MLPVNKELNLKKAAQAVGEKSVQMIPQRDLLKVSGYVHGGCSPIGMKKQYTTTLHITAFRLSLVVRIYLPYVPYSLQIFATEKKFLMKNYTAK